MALKAALPMVDHFRQSVSLQSSQIDEDCAKVAASFMLQKVPYSYKAAI
jgi:hypothetical protein